MVYLFIYLFELVVLLTGFLASIVNLFISLGYNFRYLTCYMLKYPFCAEKSF